MDHPIKMDDLGIPLFLEIPIYKVYDNMCQVKVDCTTPKRYLFFRAQNGEGAPKTQSGYDKPNHGARVASTPPAHIFNAALIASS